MDLLSVDLSWCGNGGNGRRCPTRFAKLSWPGKDSLTFRPALKPPSRRKANVGKASPYSKVINLLP